MATGKALVCKLQNIKEIEGADRIVQANLFGETVIVSKDYQEGMIGLLFDCETQLSHDFVKHNNLYRESALNVDKTKTGYMEENRRVRPIKLKGVRCSGLFMPIDSLDFTGDHHFDKDESYIGIEIDGNNGIKICQKYITQKTKQSQGKNQGGKARENLTPFFKEHIDTDQALRNLHLIQEGNLVTITEKLHGTSLRVASLPAKIKLSWWQNLIHAFAGLIGHGIWEYKQPELFEYSFLVGSRRVVKRIGEQEKEGASYYDTDIWSIAADKHFKGKLLKGETIYAEIVGYLPDGQPIMGSQSNKKLEKFMDKQEYKQFIAQYGETTEFSYGLQRGEFDVYVYRITMTNEDGESFDLSWDQVKMRCERMGVKYVPELHRGITFNQSIKGGDDGSTLKTMKLLGMLELEDQIENFTNQESDTFKSNLKEGIVLRIDNGSNTPILLKSKAFAFKVIESIIKDSDIVDVEESQG